MDTAETTLTIGKVYSVDQLRDHFLGWTAPHDRPADGFEGYQLDDYFDQENRYLGPDATGVEPIFSF